MKSLLLPLAIALLAAPAVAKEKETEDIGDYFWGVRDWSYVATFNGERNGRLIAEMRSVGAENLLTPAPIGPYAQWTALIHVEVFCRPQEEGEFTCVMHTTYRRPVIYKKRVHMASFRSRIAICKRIDVSPILQDEIEKIASLYHDYQGVHA